MFRKRIRISRAFQIKKKKSLTEQTHGSFRSPDAFFAADRPVADVKSVAFRAGNVEDDTCTERVCFVLAGHHDLDVRVLVVQRERRASLFGL